MSIFAAQLKRFYVNEVTGHHHLIKIFTHMGVFGNISDTVANISSAFK
jgi:hypothetical protein